MNYDDWKLSNPYENEEEYKCNMCDKPIEQEGYCSIRCKKADD